MGRKRAFDEHTVLSAAASEFRVHGFANTSTEQLCRATGLRRSSLYNTFVSKEELYLRALQHYCETISGQQSKLLANPDITSTERLQQLLELIVEEEHAAQLQGHAAGCMVVHSFMTPDQYQHDLRLKSILEKDLAQRLVLLKHTIEAGQKEGSIRRDLPSDSIALLITNIISGLRVTSQTHPPIEQLRLIALTSLEAVLI